MLKKDKKKEDVRIFNNTVQEKQYCKEGNLIF